MNRDDELFELPGTVVLFAVRRAKAVEIWDSAIQLGKKTGLKEPQVTALVLPLLEAIGFKLSRATLFNLRRAYLAGGLMGIVDQRSLPRDRLRKFGPFLAEFESIYTSKLIDARVCYHLCCDRTPYMHWSVPEFRDCQRYLKKYILPSLTRERTLSRPAE